MKDAYNEIKSSLERFRWAWDDLADLSTLADNAIRSSFKQLQEIRNSILDKREKLTKVEAEELYDICDRGVAYLAYNLENRGIADWRLSRMERELISGALQNRWIECEEDIRRVKKLQGAESVMLTLLEEKEKCKETYCSVNKKIGEISQLTSKLIIFLYFRRINKIEEVQRTFEDELSLSLEEISNNLKNLGKVMDRNILQLKNRVGEIESVLERRGREQINMHEIRAIAKEIQTIYTATGSHKTKIGFHIKHIYKGVREALQTIEKNKPKVGSEDIYKTLLTFKNVYLSAIEDYENRILPKVNMYVEYIDSILKPTIKKIDEIASLDKKVLDVDILVRKISQNMLDFRKIADNLLKAVDANFLLSKDDLLHLTEEIDGCAHQIVTQISSQKEEIEHITGIRKETLAKLSEQLELRQIQNAESAEEL